MLPLKAAGSGAISKKVRKCIDFLSSKIKNFFVDNQNLNYKLKPDQLHPVRSQKFGRCEDYTKTGNTGQVKNKREANC
jgi:hypothetical protein